MKRSQIYKLIDEERARQAETWKGPHKWGKGDCSSSEVAPIAKVAILTEELGEVARAVLEKEDRATFDELIQVAAVAVAWCESFDDGQAELDL